MSLPGKGLRKITVGSDNYEWTIRKRPTSGKIYHHKKLTAAIQIETVSKRGLLVVDFGVSPPNTWRNPHKTAVMPKTIEAVIKIALESGWDPLKSGTFELVYPVVFMPDPDSLAPDAGHDIRSL